MAAQPGAGTGPGSRERPAGWGGGRVPAALGGREGRGVPRDCCASPPGPPALAGACGAEPPLLGPQPPAPAPLRSSKGSTGAPSLLLSSGGIGSRVSKLLASPEVDLSPTAPHPPHPCPEHPASLPLGMMPPLGLPKQAAVAIVPPRPDGEGQAARAGLGALWTRCAGLGGCGHMRGVKCEWQAAVCVCGDRWAFQAGLPSPEQCIHRKPVSGCYSPF